MLIHKKLNLLMLLIFSLHIVACGQNTDPIKESLTKFDQISVNGKRVLSNENVEFSKLLNSLKAENSEIYSKPDYEIKIITKGDNILISVFIEEKFVYKGNYLSAWDDRMRGKYSKGYKLSKELEEFLDSN